LDARRANDPGEGLTPPLTPGGSGGTVSALAVKGISGLNSGMSAAEIIEQIKSLPPDERAEVAKFFVEDDDSWVPESFKRGMADAEAGRFVDMETVLSGAKPPPRRSE
jgi:predicted transcriptional regulator